MPHIEGLRALAIGLVVAYHAAKRLIPAGFIGVDVFFVISGFVITSSVLREVRSTGRLSLSRFWSRRMKRLLPATAVVLAAASAIAILWLPITQRRIFGWDIVGAGAYVVNWSLASRSVDYLAEDVVASPVQHFWSLAVEEQFYVVWPLAIVALLWLAKRMRRKPEGLLTLGIVVLCAGSLVVSLVWTAQNPAVAFFATPTRIWELGAGALIALGRPALGKVPKLAGRALGILGLVVIGCSALLLTDATPWPSGWAALPCFGAGALIIAGMVDSGGPSSALLSWRPLVWIGGMSYSIYLWHWPFLVGATGIYGSNLGIKRSLLVVALSLGPAWIIHKLVENPIRFSGRLASSTRLALSVGAACTAVGLLAGSGVILSSPSVAHVADRPIGAGMIASDGSNAAAILATDSYPILVPDPLMATEDQPTSYKDPCRANDGHGDQGPCLNGDSEGGLRIVAVGDSMMQQWEPALDLIGKEQGIRVELYVMHGCPFSAAPVYRQSVGGAFTRCLEWTQWVLDSILADKPDLVLVSQDAIYALEQADDPAEDQTEEAMIKGLHVYWDKLRAAGIPLAVVARNPDMGSDFPGGMYECAAQHRDDLSYCVADATYGTLAMQERAIAEYSTPVPLININQYICPADRCAAVIGGVVVFRQGSHMTKTYVETLAPMFWEALEPLLPTDG